ncbi:hypothetical protein ACJJTC_019596, partial [Scirpophaga incertulas]
SCGGDENAKPGCGINCGKLCSDVGKSKPEICPLGCSLNGCDCKDGYYYDEKVKKCVQPNDCSDRKCPMNEEFNACPATVCIPKQCTDLGFPLNCTKKNPDGSCPGKPGCICKTGYLRDGTGQCVPESQCPSCGGDENAKPGCGINCGKLCSNIGQSEPIACTLSCNLNGCDCKDGYYYDEKVKKCVLPNDCSDRKCPINEEYNACPATVCIPKQCTDLGFPLNCTEKNPDGSCPGKPGCICKTGYLRDGTGQCVPESQCPSCGGDENAKPGCGINCGKLCSDVGKSKPEICPLGCSLNGCDCKDGYYYDEKVKKCVLPNDCSDRKCPMNEEYNACPATVCIPKQCTDLGFPLNCTKKNPDGSCPGKPGCICKTGYLRDGTGQCVPESKCPSCGGDENAKPGCGINCGKLCSDVGKSKPEICPLGCSLNGCDCKDGYYYDEKVKKCVQPNDCSDRKCPMNEEYNACPATVCIPQQCTDLGFPLNCTKNNPDGSCPGKPGCICKTGYLRDGTGQCVPESQCPSCGGDQNAKPGCGTNCGKLCSDVGNSNPDKCRVGCSLNACDCKDGFYYNENTNKCVTPEECKRKCPENEIYNKHCLSPCKPRTCADLKQRDKCRKKESHMKCSEKPGCVCKLGYLRNDNGKCIPKRHCRAQDSSSSKAGVDEADAKKKCPSDNEVLDLCPTLCPARTCGIDDRVIFCNRMEVGNPECPKPKCRCKDGLYRDNNGNCVPWDKCPQCPPNQQYDPCDDPCNRRACNFDPTLVRCPLPPMLGDSRCIARCRCKDGYMSNINGTCVPENECPCKGDENAVRGCGTKCGQLCSDIGRKRPPICNSDDCVLFGCDCREGFFYDSVSKKCVRPEQCQPQCPANEVLSDCANGCQKKTCRELLSSSKCTLDPNECKRGCVCATGYLRSDNGTCVPIGTCPGPVCKENEVLTSCARTGCRRWFCSEGVVCIDSTTCEPGCDCAEGYLLDENNRCIPEKECPNSPFNCKENQIYSTCSNIRCSVRSCSDVNSTKVCVPTKPRVCLPGCICAKGYFLDPKGNCVPPERCPPTLTCKRNEVVSTCANNCGEKRYCRDITNPSPVCSTIESCVTGCVCADGYLRDDNGDCIPIEKCPELSCQQNEIFSPCANSGCRRWSCSDQQILCVDPSTCEPGCVCAKGYVWDYKRRCIPEKECPLNCKENEVYATCGNTGCSVRSCSDVNSTAVCIPNGPRECVPGCVCAKGYFLDPKGNCVPPERCPPTQTCKRNEVVSTCANNCREKRYCKDIVNPPVCLNLEFCVTGCVCADGYLRDDNGDCIPIEKCPVQTCKRNEVVSTCVNNCKAKRYCRDIANPPVCWEIYSLQEENILPWNLPICTTGCVCADGYLRDENGDCIPIDKCPAQQCPQNEVYSGCANGCQKKNCRDLSFPTECIEPKECKPGCICDKGYLRSENGTCIPIRNCPVQICKRNEVFSTCANKCREKRNCRDIANPPVLLGCADMDSTGTEYITPSAHETKCIQAARMGVKRKNCKDLSFPPECIEPKECKPGCICDNGYLRSENGTCVPIRNCPEPICKQNEILSSCANSGCRRWSCADPGILCIDPSRCETGCVCAEGYVWDDNKRCIPEKECPNSSPCKENQILSPCVNRNCQIKTCSNLTNPVRCIEQGTRECVEGCICAEGYYQDSDGNCVPPEKCPPSQTCKRNEVFSTCANNCGKKKCRDLTGPLICFDNERCVSGCVCAEGYLRDDNGECIPIEKCPATSCDGDENAQYGCSLNCGKLCSDLNSTRPICPKVCPTIGCECKDGFYYDTTIRKCVPPEKCIPVSCGGDPNAEPGCGANCGKQCEDIRNVEGETTQCRDFCTLGGCDCKPGFYFNSEIKRCVRAEQCPIICQRNEEYNECKNGICVRDNCEDRGKNIKCPQIIIDRCEPGCVCREKYFRRNGVCVPEDQCDIKCQENEIVSSCVNGGCRRRKCADLREPIICVYPRICNVGCICAKGYLMNNDGKCIPEEQCRKEYF